MFLLPYLKHSGRIGDDLDSKNLANNRFTDLCYVSYIKYRDKGYVI